MNRRRPASSKCRGNWLQRNVYCSNGPRIGRWTKRLRGRRNLGPVGIDRRRAPSDLIDRCAILKHVKSSLSSSDLDSLILLIQNLTDQRKIDSSDYSIKLTKLHASDQQFPIRFWLKFNFDIVRGSICPNGTSTTNDWTLKILDQKRRIGIEFSSIVQRIRSRFGPLWSTNGRMPRPTISNRVRLGHLIHSAMAGLSGDEYLFVNVLCVQLNADV
uniref:Uncharacterized protein n=1 Tax=Romanomermis culicivorax TaxID=13658 RepID=A0A915HY28_ROMCU